MLKVKYQKILNLQAGKTDSNPPLGTILGNLGVNSNKFTIEYNNYTKDLPSFFILKSKILIYDNRTFSFQILGFSIASILRLLKYEKTIQVFSHDRFNEQKIFCVNLKDIILLIIYMFGQFTKQNLIIILGLLKSMELVIEDKNKNKKNKI